MVDIKPIKLVDGMIMRNGQIIKSNVARDGTAKKLTTPAPTHGMRNRTAEHTLKPSFSNPLDDETLQKTYEGKQAPLHPSAKSDPQRAREHDGFEMLQSAARFGRAK
jgi:hypothetical protein